MEEGRREEEQRETEFIIKHGAIHWSENMQRFPFAESNSALCVGRVQHSAEWMDVSVPLIVPLLLLD